MINVNKPAGVTSFSVVSLVRRLSGVRRVGHAGTLDPIADGVLPILLGSATRLVEYIVDAPKSYRATVRLGAATDTYDSEGAVVSSGDPSGVTEQALRNALRTFVGEIQQLPPMYSALKHEGRPLYSYARAGKTVPREARTVTIHRLELLGVAGTDVEIELECGRGAYVRTLADDLGRLLGCGGHLVRLTRLRSGPFSLRDAVGIAQLEESAERGEWEEHLLAADRVLESWYAVLLGKERTLDVRCGRAFALEPALRALSPDTRCRAYSLEGELLAILRYQGDDCWRPEKVFAPL
ncbi:MAG: tRNA pseudouridine(55) synthase TruB [Chloroflexi bacterium]|nr:tRNA pseudouridine(55) synthase TruB [Chloroflexota bacterium]